MNTKFLAAVVGLIFVSVMINLQAQKKPGEGANDLKIIAMLFYADWCGSCKVLEPKIDQVKTEFKDESIFFTRFDLTDDFTVAQSKRFASLIGLEDVLKKNGGKTGYMVLLDARSGKVLGKLTKDKSPEDIRAAFRGALSGGKSKY